MGKLLTFDQTFHTYLRSSFPLIGINTIETDRVTELLKHLTVQWNKTLTKTHAPDWLKGSGYEFYVWDVVNGWYTPSETEDGTEYKKVAATENPIEALKYFSKDRDENGARPGVYVMQNFNRLWHDQYELPNYIQWMREIAKAGRVGHKHLILVGDNTGLPAEVQPLTVILEFELPDKQTIKAFITEYISDMGLDISKKVIEEASIASSGMTLYEVESALSVALVSAKGKTIDKDVLFAEKAKAVQRSGLLEHIPTELSMENSVGGLTNLKLWFKKVAKAFTQPEKAEKYGLPIPKGAVVVGVSGTGKTLCSKAVANLFGVSLFRCEVGRVFGGVVGETESNTRQLFRLMDALAPCVILLDEIEKSLSGLSSSDKSDAGVTSRFVSSLLYYMQEKTAPVFIMATANDVSAMPPELLRKGRFEEIWFVDLPDARERQETIQIHVKQTGRDLKKFKGLGKIATKAKNFTGAELENAVRLAMFNAFDEDREYTAKDIEEAINDIVPLAEMKKEHITALREWAEARAKKANGAQVREITTSVRKKGKLIIG